MLESMCHSDVSFVTLTYDDFHLVYNRKNRLPELVPEHLQLFIKRMRRVCEPKLLRFYGVGEYGDRGERPHYHVILFGFPSCARGNTTRDLVTGSPDAMSCCASCRIVQKKWTAGNILLGTVTRDSASYVAGYTVKKMTDKNDKRLKGRYPEFARQSLKPGIGADAMWDVASAMMQHRVYDVDVPGALRYDGKHWPLGRYLRRKLRVMTGRSINAPQATLEETQKEVRFVRENSLDVEVDALPGERMSTLLSSMSDGEYANWLARTNLWKKRRSLS